MTLLDLVKKRTEASTGLTENELNQLINADDSVLHDPFLYDGMDMLVNELHAFKQQQLKNRHHLLVIDTDYDTDGVMSAAVLSAALDVLNINYRIYIPSMSDGYGLNKKAVNDMVSQYNKNGNEVKVILTADNGTNAIAGVNEAELFGIEVLVTDHHLGGDDYAHAKVIVNPNKKMPDGTPEPYPFKGNAGAAVAWKAMMAYASRYQPDSLPLIRNLIVFAGIANVADVMPITDENHYIVKQAVEEIQRINGIRRMFGNSAFDIGSPYEQIQNTPYVHYNTVFYGLYDMITMLQAEKDAKRQAQNKKPIALKDDEELIGWYLSPMINAPRRIHATSLESMLAFMAVNTNQRQQAIRDMLQMNAQKSEMRNKVTADLDWEILNQQSGNVLFVNAQHGISGLIAGEVASRTSRAAMVFSLPTNSNVNIYPDDYFNERYDADTLVIAASARSNNMQPLNVIMERIHEIRPDIIVGGGGHANAAGYSIRYKYLDIFRILFNNVAKQIEKEIYDEYEKAVRDGLIETPVQNTVRFSFHGHEDTPEYTTYNLFDNRDSFEDDILRVVHFQQELKPFGKDFEAQTTFLLDIDPILLTEPQFNLNLGFWKTLKFNLYGVDVITFNIELADMIKERIQMKNQAMIRVKAKITMNEFRGAVTPQLQLEL